MRWEWHSDWRRAVRRRDIEQMEALIASADPEVLAEALAYAGAQDCREGMRLLLKAGVDPTTTHPDGRFVISHIVHAGREKAVQLLLDHGARVDELSTGWWPPLHAAAAEGDAEILIRLLRAGVKDISDSGRKASALHVAIEQGYLEAARVLLDGGSEVDSCRGSHRTPLGLAAGMGRLEMTRLLLARGADPNCTNPGSFDRTTPLMAAARSGSEQVVELLLSYGAEIAAQDSKGSTPLHYAEAGASPAVVQSLLQAGAEVDARDHAGRTPLMLAAGREYDRRSHLRSHEICAVLGKAGADVNALTPEGRGPLLFAAGLGDAARVKLLLDAGAQVDTPSCWGWTPLMTATTKGHREVIRLLRDAGAPPLSRERRLQIALLKALGAKQWLRAWVLLQLGAGVNCADDQGQTPLHLGLEGRPPRLGLVKKLLAAGADVNRQNAGGNPPLFSIAGEGFERFVRLLAQAGADLNLIVPRHGGTTRLMEYVRLAFIEEVEALIAAGADVNARDLQGRTPLMWAAFSASRDPERRLFRALLAAGADPTAVDDAGKSVNEWILQYNNPEVLQSLEEHRDSGKVGLLAEVAAN